MALRDTDFYVEAFKLELEATDFRTARSKLLESFLNEVIIGCQHFQPETMGDIVKVIVSVKKQFCAVCRKVPEMKGACNNFDVLIKAYDEVVYNHWKHIKSAKRTKNSKLLEFLTKLPLSEN